MEPRQFLSVVLAAVLFAQLPAPAPALASTKKDKASRVASEVVGMDPDTLIAVTLKNKHLVRGRLGQVSETGFQVQTVTGQKIDERHFQFEEVKSIRRIQSLTPTEETGSHATLEQRVIEIDPGSLVVVNLRDKSKMRGRIGQVSADGFMLLAARGTQVKDQKVAFADVASVKAVNKGGGGAMAGHIVIGALAALGVLLLIGMIAVAAGGVD